MTLGDTVLEVVSAGPIAGKLGQYEIRVKIPDGLAPGDLPIRVKVGDFSSPETATLTVGRAE